LSRYLFTLRTEADRASAWIAVRSAPDGARVEVKAAKRSTDQNARMWAMLTDVAMQLEWHGQKLSTNDWKLLFLDLLRREMRLVPNLDKTGWVNLGRSSSDLSKAEMGDLMELIAAFGAQHGVTFRDEAA
jgi:predicted NUDIX family NTP pyrophosphohydrolase